MKQTIEIILLAVLVSGSGCGKSTRSYPAPRANARADSFIMEPGPFDIESETYAADFGTITVPENRNKSTSRLFSKITST